MRQHSPDTGGTARDAAELAEILARLEAAAGNTSGSSRSFADRVCQAQARLITALRDENTRLDRELATARQAAAHYTALVEAIRTSQFLQGEWTRFIMMARLSLPPIAGISCGDPD